MKHHLFIVLMLLLPGGLAGLGGCSVPPALVQPDGADRHEILEACRHVFTATPRQFLHRVEFSASGLSAVMLGLVQVVPSHGRICAVLMTPEQLVVFEACQTGTTLAVQRQLPPFDASGWAEGLFADLTLLFLAPAASQTMTGYDADGHRICRYFQPDGAVTDIVMGPARPRRLMAYNRQRHRQAELTWPSSPVAGAAGTWPTRIDLTTRGPEHSTYRLRLLLLQTEALP